ncbi:hypothetical protein DSECCO2_538060 [anaerobic digester metagenome]|jgi:lambda repressor-like predicted transcriptional regulator
MYLEEQMSHEIKKRGISIKAISKETGIPYSSLQPSLKGRRPLRADEFFAVCDFLKVNPADFKPERSV